MKLCNVYLFVTLFLYPVFASVQRALYLILSPFIYPHDTPVMKVKQTDSSLSKVIYRTGCVEEI